MKELFRNTNRCVGMITALAMSAVSSYALAEEGVIRARVSYGLANYSSPSASSEIKSNYSTLGLGASYIWPSNVFMDFATKSSNSATYNAGSVTQGSLTTDQPFSRTEYVLTVGMPLEDRIQVNAGIFKAKTELNLAQWGQFSQKMTGVTAGAGIAYPINEGASGVAGLNAGAALLTASNTDRFGIVSNSDLSFGLSIGAAYNYPLNKYLSFAADAKLQSYMIKYPTFSGNEQILATSVSLIARF